MLEPTFKGSNFSPDGGNNNLAQLRDPKIEKAMDDAAVLKGKERYQAWADSGITGLTLVTEQPQAMELMAQLAGSKS